MNNITYIIKEPPIDSIKENKENKENNLFNNDKLIISNFDHDINNNISNELLAYRLDYDLNYTFKYLVHILEFYGLKKGKKNKKEIINKILEFEMMPENKSIINTRKHLFENFIELKNNVYFGKFILSDL